MKFRYEWKRLTEDGLLKEPSECGPHYDRSGVNSYGGFETEEEAVKAYEDFAKANKYGVDSELVLVKIYVRDWS